MAQLTDEGPRYFYKYKSIDKDHLDHSSRIFTHNELYFSRVDAFNDPFDCRFESTVPKSRRHKFLLDWLGERHPELNRKEQRARAAQLEKDAARFSKLLKQYEQDARRNVISKCGICCLSAVRDDILMWAHYANGHRGFCLEFLHEQGDGFHVTRKPTDPVVSSHSLFPFEVKYSDRYPVIDLDSNDFKTVDGEWFEHAFLTKSRQWKCEKEWRLIDNNSEGLHQFPPRFLTGVVFGCEMPEDHKDMIRGWCKDRQTPIKYYEAQRADKAYALNIVPA